MNNTPDEKNIVEEEKETSESIANELLRELNISSILYINSIS